MITDALVSDLRINILWMFLLATITLLGSCKDEIIIPRDSPAPLSCSDSSRSSLSECIYKDEIGRGQYEIRPDVAACTDDHGQVVSVDGITKVSVEYSQKTIFLRCVFQGGALSVCIQHNNCQVVMTLKECDEHLEKLKDELSQDHTDSENWTCENKAR